jgi:hypothetical protein
MSKLRAFVVSVVVLVVLLAVVALPAYGRVIHVREAGFTGADAPGGPFGPGLVSAAVDQASGDVYVTEASAAAPGVGGAVDEFDAKGVYAKVHIVGAKITGQKAFALTFTSGVAVDNSGGANNGDLYVSDTGHHVIDRFTAAGVFLCEITGKKPVSKEEEEHECDGAAGSLTPTGSIIPAGVAVDKSGDVYVAHDEEEHQAIDKFGPEGKYLGQIKDPHLSGQIGTIALDAEGHLYAQVEVNGGGGGVFVFNTAGSFVSVLDEPQHEAVGVGVDPKTGNVYVGEAAGPLGQDVAEFEPSGALASVTATNGFALGLAVDGASGKLYATEAFGSNAVAIFSPDIVLPNATSDPATSVSQTTATLNGHLDPDLAHGGAEVTGCVFEYGITTFYGQTAPCSPPPPYASGTAVSGALSGLTRGTAYHFRLKATNASGATVGEDQTFTTAGLAVIDSESARVNGTGAILRAQINPMRLATTCEVQYVDDAGFKHSGYGTASTLPCEPEDLGSGLGDTGAIAAAKGLQIATTYHFRFLADNAAGLTGSGDRTFTTFGASAFKFALVNEEGLPFTQAGGHPYEARTSLKLNGFLRSAGEMPEEGADANVKDVITRLPAGFVGDPTAVPKCTREKVRRRQCPGSAQVGTIEVNIEGETKSVPSPLYNVVPPEGVPAEFAAGILTKAIILIDAKLRSGGDYGVTAESTNSAGIAGVREANVKLWGVPAAASHDKERTCGEKEPCSAEETVAKPFLRAPTSCGGSLMATLAVDSWQNPGEFSELATEMPAMTGCENVEFAPSLAVQPTAAQADSPTGLHVDLHLPQNKEAEKLGESDLRDTTVTLPPGLTANPSGANGLAACPPAQVGLTSGPGVVPVTFTPGQAECPAASKVGTVEVDTPLLDHPLHGAVYIATPYNNPFNSLLALYITVYDPQTGVVVKLAGHVEPNPATGQLTTTVTDSPQVPFEDFKLDFFPEEPKAAPPALATPEACGTYAASASLTPWSGTPRVSPTIAGFPVSSGCTTGFAPTFTAGTTSVQAGAYAPLKLSFARSDRDQELAGLTASMPPGLLAKVAGVPLCPESALAAAAARSGAAETAGPSCPEGSQVGTVQAAAGAGGDPIVVSGKAYLTGSYKGGPYGLAVVVPAIAGPFDLGTVVVRSSLHIDPTDGHVTAVSDPFPTIFKGIPLRMRRVTVSIDRPEFTFNPTNCSPLAVTATLLSTAGASAALSQRFQVGGCQSLPFNPKFTVSTQAQTSKTSGAALDVNVTAALGEANIAKVNVSLPLALPSRLTTLQQACTATQFAANPAGCPVGSLVGAAIAHTPVLANPLAGPVYLVSHGGAAFPDLVVMLQSEGIVIALTGHTDIKHGITYSHFETVPDAPISSFELSLPSGPHSVLAAYLPASAKGSLCKSTLIMPTVITAQNGAQIARNTRIGVRGCPKRKAIKHGKAASRRLTRRHRR